MLFTESRFFPFFLTVLAVHWLLGRQRLRKVWLLGASYWFYAAWNPIFLSLIVASTLVDYVVGIQLDRPGTRRKAWLGLSLGVNLGLLGVFKYFNFFVQSAVDLAAVLGIPASFETLSIILPVGISFYTFQTLSYSLDIYFGRLKSTRNLLDLATFVAFFPQLVAGPIVRASDFLPQLVKKRRFADVDVRAALVLFLVGYFKKACISDNLAPLVDRYFLAPESYDALSAWTATVAYAIQIYCDFSGYSDMAIACAALLGYELMLNFNFPYLAKNITDFWRRWHISLSTWLRDYLYIPLGGNRGSRLFTHRNLLLTMLLGGLWHGAAWNFVIWGGLHGAALIVHKEWSNRVDSRVSGTLLGRVLGVFSPLVTLWLVCVCWIFFRAVGFEDASTTLRAFVTFQSPGQASLGTALLWIVPLLAFVHWATQRGASAKWWRRMPDWGFATSYAVLVALAQPLVATDYTPFIYFQF